MKRLCTLLILAIRLFVSAQDIHFSQFNSSPLSINPALTGLFDAQFRIVGNQRNQWSSITVPYVTSAVSFDMNARPGKREDYIGLGFLMTRDNAGDAGLGTSQFLLSMSYIKRLTEKGLFISYGMQAGFAQRRINFSQLNFENQFDGRKFDPSLGTGESLNSSSANYFDFNTGLNVFYKFKSGNNINIGYGIYHLNRPSAALLSESQFNLSPLSVLHFTSMVHLAGPFSILPGLYFVRHQNNLQLNTGTYLKYSFNTKDSRALYLGTWMRLKNMDAFIITARLEIKRINLGFSYDINSSPLSKVSNYRGATEFSLIYIFDKSKKVPRINSIPCPAFM